MVRSKDVDTHGVYHAYCGSVGAGADHPAFQALKEAFPEDAPIAQMISTGCIDSRPFAKALAKYQPLTDKQKEAVEQVKRLESESWRTD